MVHVEGYAGVTVLRNVFVKLPCFMWGRPNIGFPYPTLFHGWESVIH